MDGQIYIDLDLLVNGGMDAFLLVLTARLMQYPLQPKRLLGGVLLGEIPVLLTIVPYPWLLQITKLLTPFLMVWATYEHKSLKGYLKLVFAFWLLSAGLGGLVYASWNWLAFADGSSLQRYPLLMLGLKNVWILPLGALCYWAAQSLWQKWQLKKAFFHQTLYSLKVDFVGSGKVINVKALVDTGNSLQDPLTGAPVILLEEKVAITEVPEEWRNLLNQTWSDDSDPWSSLWKMDPLLIKHIVFIPFQAIEKKSWLIAFRPNKVICGDGEDERELKATVALVKQILSSDGTYQALLHPEHVQRGGF